MSTLYTMSSGEAALVLSMTRVGLHKLTDRGELTVRRSPDGARRYNPKEVHTLASNRAHSALLSATVDRLLATGVYKDRTSATLAAAPICADIQARYGGVSIELAAADDRAGADKGAATVNNPAELANRYSLTTEQAESLAKHERASDLLPDPSMVKGGKIGGAPVGRWIAEQANKLGIALDPNVWPGAQPIAEDDAAVALSGFQAAADRLRASRRLMTDDAADAEAERQAERERKLRAKTKRPNGGGPGGGSFAGGKSRTGKAAL